MYEHDPIEDALNQKAIELLAANRSAAKQEVIDLALRQHEQAALMDKDLTLVQQLGSEALGLYAALETREIDIIRQASRLPMMDWLKPAGMLGWDRRYNLRSERKIQRYADAIVCQRDGDISLDQAKRWARSELGRKQHQDAQNEMLLRFGHTKTKAAISASGYEYFAPPVLKSDQETNDYIAQQWRVTAMLPCSWNKFSELLQIRHEFKGVDDLKLTTTHKIYLDRDNGIRKLEVMGQDLDVKSSLAHHELFFPLGVLIKSREAVMARLPNKW